MWSNLSIVAHKHNTYVFSIKKEKNFSPWQPMACSTAQLGIDVQTCLSTSLGRSFTSVGEGFLTAASIGRWLRRWVQQSRLGGRQGFAEYGDGARRDRGPHRQHGRSTRLRGSRARTATAAMPSELIRRLSPRISAGELLMQDSNGRARPRGQWGGQRSARWGGRRQWRRPRVAALLARQEEMRMCGWKITGTIEQGPPFTPVGEEAPRMNLRSS